MRFDDSFCDEETKAMPLARGFFGLAVRIEHVGQHVFADSGAGVFN